VKALGLGLSGSLGLSEIPIERGGRDALENDDEMSKRHENWYLQKLEAGSLYRAALAVEGSPVLVKCWRWEGAPLGRSVLRSSAEVTGTILIHPAD
jgi:hypothetical protein